MTIDLSFCRSMFPSLRMQVNGKPVVFFDGPGGTQVPQTVVDAVANYLAFENANTHGSFYTTRKTDERIHEARCAMADLLGCDPDEIAFGNNMTTLNYALSRALARLCKPGDRVVITQLDHEANRGPWQTLEEKGAEIVEGQVNLSDCTLDMNDMRRKIVPGTKVVALGYASNAVGTINDVKTVCTWAREVGAVSVVDAVHYAAHGVIDVRDIGCDFLVCSTYKFFGPHVGVLYGKKESFDRLEAYKLLPQSKDAPFKIESGTLNHEGIAGIAPAIDFIARISEKATDLAGWASKPTSRREKVIAGMSAIEEYEMELARKLWGVLNRTPGIKVYGLGIDEKRTPTFSFTMEGANALEVAEFLGDRGIFVWAGDFYATTLVKMLGLKDKGPLVRIGLAPYNVAEDVTRLKDALDELVKNLHK